MTLDEAYDQFRLLLDKYFPEIITSTGYAGPEFHAELPDQNRLYSKTPYFYKGELNFIHWTSIPNLLSILNDREIRLYNLHSSKDQTEFNFAAKELGMENSQIDYAKKYYYTFSFCELADLSNKYLWAEFGKDSTGVAVEFTIENDPDNWDNFMMSRIFYDMPSNFKPFIEEFSVLQKQGISLRALGLGKLIGFHKKKDFHNENEVRIATYFPYRNFEEYLKYAKTEFRIENDSKRNRVTNYISLPLWVDNDSGWVKSDKADLDRSSPYSDEYFKKRPKLRIKNIYFGKNCGIDNSDLSKFTRELEDIIRFNLGYRVRLEYNIYSI